MVENRNLFTKYTKEQIATSKTKDPDIYIDNDGLARCKYCHEPRMWFYEEYDTWLSVSCDCIKKRDEADRRKSQIGRNISQSGIYGKLLKANLNKMTVSSGNAKAFNSCAKYVGIFETAQKKGWGIYLYGKNGSGKTYLACAVGNALLQQGIIVKYASVSDILVEIRSSYYNRADEVEKNIISKYADAEFLIIDDICSETYNKATEASTFAQEKLFTIINKRNLNELPTFFISEFSIDDLQTEGHILAKTVRLINEMANRKIKMCDIYTKSKNIVGLIEI